MTETVIQRSLPTLLDDGINEGEELLVTITVDSEEESVAVDIDGKFIKGEDIVALGKLVEINSKY